MPRLVNWFPLLAVPFAAIAQTPEQRFSGRLFADFNYVASQRAVAQGFRLGQLAAHTAAAITDHLAFFGEATLSPTATGYAPELERSILRYDFADVLKISAGRFHTPLGHWNTAYHHGVWLQTPTARPEALRGDRLLLPIHFVGAMVEGNIAGRLVGATYSSGVGNGRAASASRAGDPGDVNTNRAWLTSLALRLVDFAPGRLGVSLYQDAVQTGTGAALRRLDERLVVAHFSVDGDPLELAAEALVLRHRERAAGAPTWTSRGSYVLVAYRLPGRAGAIKPYVRYDRIRPAAADPIAGSAGADFTGWLAGARYDFTSLAAVKTEFRRERDALSSWRNTAIVQVSFTFPGLASGGSEPHDAPHGPEDR